MTSELVENSTPDFNQKLEVEDSRYIKLTDADHV